MVSSYAICLKPMTPLIASVHHEAFSNRFDETDGYRLHVQCAHNYTDIQHDVLSLAVIKLQKFTGEAEICWKEN